MQAKEMELDYIVLAAQKHLQTTLTEVRSRTERKTWCEWSHASGPCIVTSIHSGVFQHVFLFVPLIERLQR
jgi:hypothetical protein